jgi:hypothetical protein
MIKLKKCFTSKERRNHEFVVEFNNGIWYFFSRLFCYTIDSSEIDFKKYNSVYFEDIPEWANRIISSCENNKEQFEIKFTYIEDGITKKGIEYIDVNCFKQDENMHKIAEEQFIRDYSDKYNGMHIISVTYC